MKMDTSSIIHPSAIIEDGAKIGSNCKIGPFCFLGSKVELNDGVILDSHVSLSGLTVVGSGTRVWPFSSIQEGQGEESLGVRE